MPVIIFIAIVTLQSIMLYGQNVRALRKLSIVRKHNFQHP